MERAVFDPVGLLDEHLRNVRPDGGVTTRQLHFDSLKLLCHSKRITEDLTLKLESERGRCGKLRKVSDIFKESSKRTHRKYRSAARKTDVLVKSLKAGLKAREIRLRKLIKEKNDQISKMRLKDNKIKSLMRELTQLKSKGNMKTSMNKGKGGRRHPDSDSDDDDNKPTGSGTGTGSRNPKRTTRSAGTGNVRTTNQRSSKNSQKKDSGKGHKRKSQPLTFSHSENHSEADSILLESTIRGRNGKINITPRVPLFTKKNDPKLNSQSSVVYLGGRVAVAGTKPKQKYVRKNAKVPPPKLTPAVPPPNTVSYLSIENIDRLNDEEEELMSDIEPSYVCKTPSPENNYYQKPKISSSTSFVPKANKDVLNSTTFTSRLVSLKKKKIARGRPRRLIPLEGGNTSSSDSDSDFSDRPRKKSLFKKPEALGQMQRLNGINNLIRPLSPEPEPEIEEPQPEPEPELVNDNDNDNDDGVYVDVDDDDDDDDDDNDNDDEDNVFEKKSTVQAHIQEVIDDVCAGSGGPSNDKDEDNNFEKENLDASPSEDPEQNDTSPEPEISTPTIKLRNRTIKTKGSIRKLRTGKQQLSPEIVETLVGSLVGLRRTSINEKDNVSDQVDFQENWVNMNMDESLQHCIKFMPGLRKRNGILKPIAAVIPMRKSRSNSDASQPAVPDTVTVLDSDSIHTLLKITSPQIDISKVSSASTPDMNPSKVNDATKKLILQALHYKNPILEDPTIKKNVEVPQWVYTTLKKAERLNVLHEELTDANFIKRHLKSENKERQRKRWDVQQCRQKHYEHYLRRQQILREERKRRAHQRLLQALEKLGQLEPATYLPISVETISLIVESSVSPNSAFGHSTPRAYSPIKYSVRSSDSDKEISDNLLPEGIKKKDDEVIPKTYGFTNEDHDCLTFVSDSDSDSDLECSDSDSDDVFHTKNAHISSLVPHSKLSVSKR